MPAGPRRLPVPERRNGERDKVREAICTASTESAVNQVISKRTVKNSRCAGTTRCPVPLQNCRMVFDLGFMRSANAAR